MFPWFRLFRIVNLPTVPGDVLVGAASLIAGGAVLSCQSVAAAALAATALYSFGLVDNDLVGATSDVNRPIAAGEISRRAAEFARGCCLLVAFVLAAIANLPPVWWISAFLLTVTIVAYNRSKNVLAMGLCRGLNVISGGAALMTSGFSCTGAVAVGALALLWTAYVAGVTKYSEGEEADPRKRARVGFLIGALVYLQLLALLSFAVLYPTTRRLLVAGAMMLVLLRILRHTFPKVSAS